MNTGSIRLITSRHCALLLSLAVVLWNFPGCSQIPERSEDILEKPGAQRLSANANPVRQNVSDFVNNSELVDAYRQATDIMRKNGAADPSSEAFRTSLQFWANTLGYFGTSGLLAVAARQGCSASIFLTGEKF